ncbi:MAG: hypothetical protein M3290_02050, partial [Actinomycetota bacterium]|nr:hypothetical protein [Actinomycetota bacterium]
FLLPLAFERIFHKDWKSAIGAATAGVATFALINLPFALVNFDGWWATYKFHDLRGPNYDDIWAVMFPRIGVSDLNRITALLTLAGFVVVLGYAWIRARGSGTYPFVNAAAALLCV